MATQTKERIDDMIQALNIRLAEPAMQHPENKPVKDAFEVLVKLFPHFHNNRLFVKMLSKEMPDTVRARAIVLIGVDWLMKQAEDDVLYAMPIYHPEKDAQFQQDTAE